MHSTARTPFAVRSPTARTKLLRSPLPVEEAETVIEDDYPVTLEDRFLASIDEWMYRHPILGNYAAFGSLAAVVLIVAAATVLASV